MHNIENTVTVITNYVSANNTFGDVVAFDTYANAANIFTQNLCINYLFSIIVLRVKIHCTVVCPFFFILRFIHERMGKKHQRVVAK